MQEDGAAGWAPIKGCGDGRTNSRDADRSKCRRGCLCFAQKAAGVWGAGQRQAGRLQPPLLRASRRMRRQRASPTSAARAAPAAPAAAAAGAARSGRRARLRHAAGARATASRGGGAGAWPHGCPGGQSAPRSRSAAEGSIRRGKAGLRAGSPTGDGNGRSRSSSSRQPPAQCAQPAHLQAQRQLRADVQALQQRGPVGDRGQQRVLQEGASVRSERLLSVPHT